MTITKERLLSVLLYGYSGAGKTATAVSAGWDWTNLCSVRNLLWVTFGREDNPALRVPEEMRVRLTSPTLDSTKFITDFEALMKKVWKENHDAVKAGKPRPTEVLVIDGLSEFDLLFELVFKNKQGTDDKFAMWNALLDKFFSIMQMADPNELLCHVIVTARVTEKKEEKKGRGGVITEGDPDFITTDYMPSVRGSFREHFPHYFNLVLYIERDVVPAKVGGVQTLVNVHRVRMVPERKFLVKNHWEHVWPVNKAVFDNPTFDDILDTIKEISK